MQWTAAVSSKRFRQTLQNLLLWCVGSDQQCATGFLIKHGATPEHGVTTLVTHFSWTIKLQTVKRRNVKSSLACHSFVCLPGPSSLLIYFSSSFPIFRNEWRQKQHAFLSLWHAHLPVTFNTFKNFSFSLYFLLEIWSMNLNVKESKRFAVLNLADVSAEKRQCWFAWWMADGKCASNVVFQVVSYYSFVFIIVEFDDSRTWNLLKIEVKETRKACSRCMWKCFPLFSRLFHGFEGLYVRHELNN